MTRLLFFPLLKHFKLTCLIILQTSGNHVNIGRSGGQDIVKHINYLQGCYRLLPAVWTLPSLPSSTNAVESLHRATKQKYPDVLRVALMTVYKVDMAQTLEHIAAKKQIPTTYERLTPDVRTARLRTTKKANMKRMRDKANDDDEGPPDKRSNFSKYQ